MRNSTAVRCSSPDCAVHGCHNVIPLMRPFHTHGHPLPLVNLRLLSVVLVPLPKILLRHACRTGCIAAAHTCVRHPAGSPRSAVRQTLFFVLEHKKYALRTSTNASTFPSRPPVAISDSTTFSASNGVDAYSSGLACVLYSSAPTSRAR